MLSPLEQTRPPISQTTESKKKSQLGQFFTPAASARFMAGLFNPAQGGECRLLDAGAGIGSLSGAFLERCAEGGLRFDTVEATAFEFDEALHAGLQRTLSVYAANLPLRYEIHGGDFIEHAVNRLQFGQDGFTHAILNPPYKKINNHSRHRLLLRQAGIETVNLYSAFVALALLLMAPGGQVAAIVPRSFCNGPYYRPFRDTLLQHAALRRLHLFASRTQAFKDDGVLQENLILLLERGGQQGAVTVSTSTDDGFADLDLHDYPFEHIVLPGDSERFIHVPASPLENPLARFPGIRYSLIDLGIQVSTGPVVDFRLQEYLRELPATDTVPLLYPLHFSAGVLEWPKPGAKKANAIVRNEHTEKWLYPNGFYCVARRFSAKEEKRRIVAGVVNPAVFKDTAMLGFENHLNVFHNGKHGLPEALVHGLAVFLNTTAVDESFRRFNGHTQVNATDLRQMRYPSRETLTALGEWAMQQDKPSQATIDSSLERLRV
jgi:adenine-specific DNA-methyltransferase